MWRDKWSSVQNMLVRRRKTGDVSWKALCHVQPHDVWWVRPLDTCTIRKGAYKHKHHPLVICHELTRTRTRTDAHTGLLILLRSGLWVSQRDQNFKLPQCWKPGLLMLASAGKIYSGCGKISQSGHIDASQELWTACAVCFLYPSVLQQLHDVFMCH